VTKRSHSALAHSNAVLCSSFKAISKQAVSHHWSTLYTSPTKQRLTPSSTSSSNDICNPLQYSRYVRFRSIGLHGKRRLRSPPLAIPVSSGSPTDLAGCAVSRAAGILHVPRCTAPTPAEPAVAFRRAKTTHLDSPVSSKLLQATISHFATLRRRSRRSKPLQHDKPTLS
jgi:hypothetical protein